MSKLMPWGIAYPLPKWSHLRNGKFKFKFKLLWSVNVKIVVFAIQMDPPPTPLSYLRTPTWFMGHLLPIHTQYSRSIIQVRTINNAQRLRRWSMYTYVLPSTICMCVCVSDCVFVQCSAHGLLSLGVFSLCCFWTFFLIACSNAP